MTLTLEQFLEKLYKAGFFVDNKLYNIKLSFETTDKKDIKFKVGRRLGYIKPSHAYNVKPELLKGDGKPWSKGAYNLPVLSSKIKIGRSIQKLTISTLESGKLIVTPNITHVMKKVNKNADPYAIVRIYAVGEYCTYKGELYRAKSRIDGKSPFRECEWEKVEPLDWCLCLETMDLPDEFLLSNLFEYNILTGPLYKSLTASHNTCLGIDRYNRGLEIYKTNDSLAKAISKIVGFNVRIKTTDLVGPGYVIIERVNL